MSAAEFKEGRSVEDVCSAMGDVDKLVQFAKAAEVAERYEDMVTIVKAMARAQKDAMTVEQRNLFSVAFKNVVGALRASWRVLDSIRESKEDGDQVAQARDFQASLEAELRKVCGELLELVDRKGEDMDGAVFFQKMAGDYHRYMAEIEAGKEKGGNPEHARNALDAYTRAYDLACTGNGSADGLAPTNPIRLGLALNFSVFHYEIQKQPGEACEMAKTAFDGAISELDNLSADEYKDSTLIMQLIRDNLTLWQSDEMGDGAAAPEQDGTAVEEM